MPSPQEQQQQAQQQQAIAAVPQPAPTVLKSAPGCQRDGTRLSTSTYVDMKWFRFWQDLPRKMLGYREQVRDINGIANNIDIFPSGGFAYVHTGTPNAYQRYAISLSDGTNTGTIDRTPSGYVANPNNIWQDDVIFQDSGGLVQIFAAATPALADIADETVSQVYYGPVTAPTALIPAVFAIAAAPAGVAFSQTLAGVGNLILNVNAPIPPGSGHLTVTDDGNLTALTITVTGTDPNGNPLTVGPTNLPNNATLDLGAAFGSVSQATVSGGTGGLHISLGWAAGSNNLTTTGGLCVIGPYLFLYGAGGVISWSVPGNPLDFVDTTLGSSDARPVSDKIIRGMPIRGQSAPAGIFWSLSSVIIGNFNGVLASNFWSFNTISTNSSLLSQNGIVEHAGIYYWATTHGFAQFSGVVQNIPNNYNQQYFLDNLNFSQRQKAFAYKVPRFNEIWWCFPFGTATECNHAVILNYTTGYWYDTPLPNGGRSAGHYDVTYSFPIMAGVDINEDTAGTSIWQHETGLNEISGRQPSAIAIDAFIATHEISVLPTQAGTPGDGRTLSYSVIEPDFADANEAQAGDITMELFTRANARAPIETPSDEDDADLNYPFVIPANPADQEDEELEFKWSGRLTSFLFRTNTVNGNLIWGRPLLWMKPSDGRRT